MLRELSETSSSFIAVVNPSRAIGEIDEGDAASLGGEGSIEVWVTGVEGVEEETMGADPADIMLL